MPATTEKRKYLEIADYLRGRISSGELKVGERLPSYAELYDQHGASTATVQRACALLDREQLIERRHGSGMFVAAPRQTRTGTIGLMGSQSFKSPEMPFYSHLMHAIYQGVESEQRHLLYLGKGDSWDPTTTAKVDGVLLCGMEETVPALLEMPPQLPRVSVLSSFDGITSIGIDQYRGAQMAVRHLIELGHKRIGCLMEKDAWEARRRVGGYQDALQEYGIEADPSWKRLVEPIIRSETRQPYVEWAQKHMRTWLRDGWHEACCTALLVQNDAAAIGALQMLQQEGIKVPEQVSVMGFDGTEICDLISPRLSSVALPLEQIGAKAVEILNRQIAGEPSSGETIFLPVSLRHGESVGPASG